MCQSTISFLRNVLQQQNFRCQLLHLNNYELLYPKRACSYESFFWSSNLTFSRIIDYTSSPNVSVAHFSWKLLFHCPILCLAPWDQNFKRGKRQKWHILEFRADNETQYFPIKKPAKSPRSRFQSKFLYLQRIIELYRFGKRFLYRKRYRVKHQKF